MNNIDIFVAIASYRDPECEHTISNLLEKAKWPKQIKIGVCLQLGLEDDSLKIISNERIKVLNFDISESKGACWAKKRAMSLWNGERYVLMIDSHMRFERNWDKRMIDMLAQCPSDKAILSTYPASYTPPNNLIPSTPHLIAKKFDARTKILKFEGRPSSFERPKRGAFIAGGFVFSKASLFQEVPYDEDIYFYGEEILFSVRAWTWGWDVYAPNESLIYHYYGRSESKKHWDDCSSWPDLETASRRKLLRILGTEVASADDEKGDAVFGTARTLKEYESFSGIDFQKMTIRKAASLGVFEDL